MAHPWGIPGASRGWAIPGAFSKHPKHTPSLDACFPIPDHHPSFLMPHEGAGVCRAQEASTEASPVTGSHGSGGALHHLSLQLLPSRRGRELAMRPQLRVPCSATSASKVRSS
jgi:hypothetical protein